MIYVTPYIMQRSEKYFPNGNTFDPERWLNDGDAPKAGKAWRPFEHGPRSCAGQELAMIEMQAILSLVTRKFEFREGYTESGCREGRELPRIPDHGDWAYPITHTTRHPACGLPMFVKRV
jgi:cytochrome P450